MELRVLIVDDEHLGRRNLECLLAQAPLVTVVGSCDRAEKVLPEVLAKKPDLIFLDIQMPKQNGLQLMAQLKARCRPTPGIIFVTAHEQFAVDAFGLHALDYLLKPFSDKRLLEALEHARHRIMTDRQVAQGADPTQLQGVGPYVVMKERGQIFRLAHEDIHWIEAADHYLVVHAADGSHIWRHSLSGFLETCVSDTFWQIHRSAAVNRKFVAGLNRDEKDQAWLLLNNGERLRVSRRRYRFIREALLESECP